jgi:hypothetical protein
MNITAGSYDPKVLAKGGNPCDPAIAEIAEKFCHLARTLFSEVAGTDKELDSAKNKQADHCEPGKTR